MKQIKLIGCDLDGTFFPNHEFAPKENIEAVAKARESGITVCPCTTRNHIAGKRMMNIGGFDDYAVICNGGAIINRHTKEVLHKQPIPAEYIIKLVRICEEAGLSCGIFTPTKLIAYMPTFAGGFDRIFEQEGTPEERYTYAETEEELFALCDGEALLLIITSGDGSQMDLGGDFLDQVNAIGPMVVTSSNPAVAEILAEGVSKGGTLARLAEMLEIEQENVMAMGDNYNDAPMVEWAGFGVAMGNAVDDCKAVANHVTDTADNAGVAKAIHKVLDEME